MRELGAVAMNRLLLKEIDKVMIAADVIVILLSVVLPAVLIIRFVVTDRREKKAKAEEETAKQEASRQAQAETEARIEKYATTTVARTVAENLVKLMHDGVDGEIRDIRKSEVRCNIGVKFEPYGSGGTVRADLNGIFDFSKDNLQLPEDMTAFIRAIGSLATKMYKAQYPRDKSGTIYTLGFDFHKWGGEFSFDGYYLTYTAPNGFYVPPKSW